MTTINIQELPDPQREILRILFFADGHKATLSYIIERTYQPDEEVYEALLTLRNAGHVTTQSPQDGNYRTYSPSADMIGQMRTLNQAADADIRAAFDQAKRGNDER